MNGFQTWILNVLTALPELNIEMPDFLYDFLHDILSIINCFIDFSLFLPLMQLSIFYAFVNISIALFDYIRSFFNSTF